MKKLLLFPCFFIAFTLQAQTKLTIQSISEKCAVVASNAKDKVQPQEGFRDARFLGGNFYVTIRGFLQFDLSSIPTGSFVNWARLSLFSTGENFGPNTSQLRRITSTWNPASVTWNTQPSTSKRGQVLLPASTSASEDYKNINVTNLVQAMLDSPAESFGFELKLDTDETGIRSRGMDFISPSFNMPHKNPKLVIEYTAPGVQSAVTSKSIDNGLSTEMTIYPNPCNKTFNCNIKSASSDNMTLRVIDMLGRTVYSQPVNASILQMLVNLPSSSAGTYFVVLQGNKGAAIVSQQLQVN